jgi:hypothetical protein
VEAKDMRKITKVIVCMMLIPTFLCIFPIKISVANEPLYVPMSPYPKQNSTGVPINANLGWIGDNPNPSNITLYFIKPKNRDLYIGDRLVPLQISKKTLVIGKITVEVYAIDNPTGNTTGISHVEFYIDNRLVGNADTGVNNTYSWIWDERGYFFPYILGAKAYDLVGNSASIQMRVWKIL